MRSAFCNNNNREWKKLGCKSSSINCLPTGAFQAIQFSGALKTFSTTLLRWIMRLSELRSSFKVLLKRLRKTWAAIILFNDITIKIVSLVHSFVRKCFYSRYICHPRSNTIENLVLHMQHSSLSELDRGVQAETVVCDIFVTMLRFIS